MINVMNKKGLGELFMYIVALILLLLCAETTLGETDTESWNSQEYEDPYYIKFNFGDNCQRLETLTEANFIELLKSRYREHWQYFCVVEEPLQCEDYSDLFENFGYLEGSAENPDVCQFKPFRPIQDWLPDMYRNMGASPDEDKSQQLQGGHFYL